MSKKKVLLVLGASSDIGYELIKRVACNYDLVIAHYCHSSQRLNELKYTLETQFLMLQSDFSDKKSVIQFIDEIKKLNMPPSHIVHFPASKITYTKVHKLKNNHLANELEISLVSFFSILRALLPEMIKLKKGKIIIMLSSSVNNIPPRFLSTYVTTKYALLGLVKSLAVDYADKGITVNGVSPDMMKTKFLSDIPDFIVQQTAEKSPIGRILMVEDVIPTFEYLLSDAADCITGQNISITAGK